MSGNIRSAAIGGLAATFVVATAFLPRLIAGEPGPTSVVVTPSASQTEVPVDIDTASTLEAPSTTTTEAPSTTTTEAPTTTTTTVRATTTTTTAPAPVPPTVGAIQVLPDGLSVYFYNHQDAASRAAFPNPAVRLLVTTPDGEQEVVSPLPVQENGRFTIAAPGATAFTVIATEWDGGYLPTGGGDLARVVSR